MEDISKVYPKMFMWLFVGLLLSFGIGYYLSINTALMINVLSIGIWPIIVLELAIAFIMGFMVKKMNTTLCIICYLIYSIVTGLTFSAIFVTFEISSIMSIFAICALIFLLLAIYGYVTKTDLSRFGTIIFISLIGLIVGELLNALIFKSPQAYIIFSSIGVAIFAGYIAYDVNRVKYLLSELGEDKAAIYGAFQLYLDFINLFIRLLELFGKNRD